MKKHQHDLNISLQLDSHAWKGNLEFPENTLYATGRLRISRDATGDIQINAQLTLADSPLAQQVFRRLDWLDGPL